MSDEFDVGVPNHTVTARLGRGGMASVYLALDRTLNRNVAIKVMDGTLEADPGFVRRFEREAQVAAGLVHPNIVSVHHYGQTEAGRWYLTMDYVDGGSLADRLKRGPLDMESALGVTRDIASALAAAHARQIVHRDIKPDNILFQGDSACLTDFGIAKLLDATTQLTTVGSPGTVRYMSPEQIEGGAVDGRTDIYALGVVLQQMLTGTLPVEAPSLTSMLYRIVNEPPTPLPADCAGLQPLLNAMLAKRPAGRIDACEQLADIVRTIQRNVIRGLPQAQLCSGTGLAGAPAGTNATSAAPASHTQIAPTSDTVQDPTRMEDTSATRLDPTVALPLRQPGNGSPATQIRATPTGSGQHGSTRAQTLPGTQPAQRRPVALIVLLLLALPIGAGGLWLAITSTPPAALTGSPPSAVPAPASDALPDLSPGSSADPSDSSAAAATQAADSATAAGAPPGVVTITTVPAHASLSIDGGAAVMAPLAGEPLPAGRYRVRATAPGHAPLDAVVEVSSGDVMRRQLELQPLPGEIRIDSNPRGAWIELDGQRIAAAVTPHTIIRLTPGEHSLRLGSNSFQPSQRTVNVRPGETSELTVNLQATPQARLSVRTVPTDATVTLEDAPAGYRPGMPLPTGRWRVQISRDGYAPQERQLDLGSGDHQIDVQLEPLAVVLDLRLTPAGASVELERDGQRSPWRPGAALAPGPLTLHVSAPGFAPLSQRHTLTADDATLALTLRPAARSAGSRFRDALAGGGEGPALVVLPAGSFDMGDLDGSGQPQSRPVRRVSVPRAFAMARFETSWDEYTPFANATGRTLPDDHGWGRGQRPVLAVSYADAAAYVRWLSAQTGASYRLPSEAEWEYAVRAGSRSRYSFGDEPSGLCSHANVRTFPVPGWPAPVDCDDGYLNTAPVGSFAANPFGLNDLHGNVSEWVSDCWHDTLVGAPTDSRAWDADGSCERRVIRGGSFYHAAQSVTAAFRYGVPAGVADVVIGFRVVRELPGG